MCMSSTPKLVGQYRPVAHDGEGHDVCTRSLSVCGHVGLTKVPIDGQPKTIVQDLEDMARTYIKVCTCPPSQQAASIAQQQHLLSLCVTSRLLSHHVAILSIIYSRRMADRTF